jgi:hypothetical protein
MVELKFRLFPDLMLAETTDVVYCSQMLVFVCCMNSVSSKEEFFPANHFL